MVAAVALVMLFWAVIRVFGSIESAFNNIWEVKVERSITRQWTDYIAVVMIVPILWIVANAVGKYAQDLVGFDDSWYFELLSRLASMIVIWVMFTFLYIIIPNAKVRFGSALMAGIVAGTIFLLFQWGYVYVQRWMTSYNAIYGSFAALRCCSSGSRPRGRSCCSAGFRSARSPMSAGTMAACISAACALCPRCRAGAWARAPLRICWKNALKPTALSLLRLRIRRRILPLYPKTRILHHGLWAGRQRHGRAAHFNTVNRCRLDNKTAILYNKRRRTLGGGRRCSRHPILVPWKEWNAFPWLETRIFAGI